MKNIHQYKNTSLVNKVFDGAFKKYDMMNDIMSLGTHRIWKQQFVDTVILENNNTIVDMASGTGDISRLLIQKNKSKETVGSLEDFTEETPQPETKLFESVVGQDSLNRFDRPNKKQFRRNRKNKNKNRHESK